MRESCKFKIRGTSDGVCMVKKSDGFVGFCHSWCGFLPQLELKRAIFSFIFCSASATACGGFKEPMAAEFPSTVFSPFFKHDVYQHPSNYSCLVF